MLDTGYYAVKREKHMHFFLHIQPHRLINALGYVGETGDRPAMDTTGLMHCAIVSRALRGSNDAPTAGPHEVSAEILVAQYRRYNAQIQAKL